LSFSTFQLLPSHCAIIDNDAWQKDQQWLAFEINKIITQRICFSIINAIIDAFLCFWGYFARSFTQNRHGVLLNLTLQGSFIKWALTF
jgi:hypothetical protein